MAAPAFRDGSANVINSSTGNIDLTKPSGLANGDYLIAFISCGVSDTPTAPSGWSLLRSNSSGIGCFIYGKAVTNAAGEPATYTWGGTSGTNPSGAIVAYVNATLDVHALQLRSPDAGSVIAPSVTTTGADRTVVVAFCPLGNPTLTNAGGFTTRVSRASTGDTNMVGDFTQATAGATATKTATYGGISSSVGCTVALYSSTVSLSNTASDSAPATDANVRSVMRPKTASDSAPATDSVARSAFRPARATADSVGGSDSNVIRNIRSRTATDLAHATDANSRAVARFKAATDVLGGTDAATLKSLKTHIGASDSAPAADSSTTSRVLVRTTSDSASANDAAVKTLVRTRTAGDSAPATDSATRSIRVSVSASDAVPTVETVTKATAASRSTADSAPAADAAVKTLGRGRFTSDAAPTVELTAFGRQPAGTVTSLALNPDGTNATTALTTTARELLTSGLTAASPTTKIARVTGWDVWPARGSTAAWAAAGSMPAQNGEGFLYETAALEGMTIVAGNWSGSVSVLASNAGTVAITMRISVYNITSATYTTVGTITATATALTTSAQVVSFAATAMSAVALGTDDRIYIDYPTNITVAGGANNGTITMQEGTANTSVSTPGYRPTDQAFIAGAQARDNLGGSDSAAAGGAQILTATASDSTGETDSANSSVTLRQVTADTAAATDSVIAVRTYARTVFDSAPATDVAARTNLTQLRVATDSALAADTDSRVLRVARTSTDSAPATEVVSRIAVASRSAVDTEPATDVTTRGGVIEARTIADSAPAVDSLSRVLSSARVSADSALATDSASRTRSTLLARAATDSAVAVDSAQRVALTQTRVSSDVAAATDGAIRTVITARAGADSLPAIDAARLSLLRLGIDFAPAVDSPTRRGVYTRIVGDSAPLVDALTHVPSNDAFANATALASTSDGEYTFDITGASVESGETSPANGHTVWFTWTCPQDMKVSFDTADTPAPRWDSYINVYSGTSLATLTLIVGDDDSLLQPGVTTPDGFGTSQAIFNATAGTTYHVQVDSYDYGAGGGDPSAGYPRTDCVLRWSPVINWVARTSIPTQSITGIFPDGCNALTVGTTIWLCDPFVARIIPYDTVTDTWGSVVVCATTIGSQVYEWISSFTYGGTIYALANRRIGSVYNAVAVLSINTTTGAITEISNSPITVPYFVDYPATSCMTGSIGWTTTRTGNTTPLLLLGYDVVANTWHLVDKSTAFASPDYQYPNWDNSIASDGTKIYMVEGQGNGDSSLTTLIYDTTSTTWSTLDEPPFPGTAVGRFDPGALFYGDVLFVFGGSYNNSVAIYPTRIALYDRTLDAWDINTSTIPAGRAGPSMGLIGNVAYMIGGWDGTAEVYSVYSTVLPAHVINASPPVPQPPTITAIIPPTARVGDVVRVFGTNFDTVTNVDLLTTAFGATYSASFVIGSPTQLTFTVPNIGVDNILHVRVTNPGGTAQINFGVHVPPQNAAGSPPFGAPGWTGKITGNYLYATAVMFGSVPAQILSSFDTQVTFIIPDIGDEYITSVQLVGLGGTIDVPFAYWYPGPWVQPPADYWGAARSPLGTVVISRRDFPANYSSSGVPVKRSYLNGPSDLSGPSYLFGAPEGSVYHSGPEVLFITNSVGWPSNSAYVEQCVAVVDVQAIYANTPSTYDLYFAMDPQPPLALGDPPAGVAVPPFPYSPLTYQNYQWEGADTLDTFGTFAGTYKFVVTQRGDATFNPSDQIVQLRRIPEGRYSLPDLPGGDTSPILGDWIFPDELATLTKLVSSRANNQDNTGIVVGSYEITADELEGTGQHAVVATLKRYITEGTLESVTSALDISVQFLYQPQRFRYYFTTPQVKDNNVRVVFDI